MCGIAGIFRRDGERVDTELLVRMTRTLEHRGPDDEGYYVNSPGPPEAAPAGVRFSHAARAGKAPGSAGLGHRRLSIIDLSTGHQPLANEDESVWVVFNGEIYNFRELKRDLEARGHRFRTHSDTEVIVHAYEEWGVDAVSRFRGMFAIALWDEPRERLWLVRDRLGKKPLYYAADDRRIAFASEIKALLEEPGLSREIDLEALSDYLSLLYVPGPKSIFRSVRKLPAAHDAVITRERIEIRRYWDLPFAPVSAVRPERAMDDLIGLLDEATALRMISDVPLGAFLSGGVDSSAVVALMARRSREPVVTNSIAFSVAAYDESRHARRVAEVFGTRHHETRVTPEAIPVVERLAWHYDEPFADSSAVPTFYVSETARRNVTVALSGDGGDENFAGYRRYWFDLRENAVRDLVPAPLRRPVFGLLGSLYPKADWLPRIFRGKAFLSNVARDPVEAYFFSVSACTEETKSRLIGGDVRRALGGYRSSARFHEIYRAAPAEDHLSRIQYLDVQTYLCDDILAKVDRASMAVSLEVRCPVLDHVFMEYVARLPSRFKLSGREGKSIFKKALEPLLPREILYRPKMGFGVPILEWLRDDLRDYGEEITLHGEATRNYLDEGELRRLWREHQSGLRNWSTELWTVMMLNLWHRRFVERA